MARHFYGEGYDQVRMDVEHVPGPEQGPEEESDGARCTGRDECGLILRLARYEA